MAQVNGYERRSFNIPEWKYELGNVQRKVAGDVVEILEKSVASVKLQQPHLFH
jgi:hypothetical protein